MELSLFEIWESMSLLSRLVAISLLGMGVASFAVIIERTWVLRRTDRESMEFAFDLWSYDDVSAHADEILARVRSGTMPCDGAWPEERVDAFQSWIDAGKPR